MTDVQACLTDPQAVDDLLNEPGSLAKRNHFGHSALAQVRWAQMLNTRGTPEAASEALRLTANLDTAPARGVRMLAQVALRLYEDVAATDPAPTGHSPLELEDACHAHSAAAMAHAQLQNHQEAIGHVYSAITLATALGLHNRLQTLEIELCRIQSLTGVGDTDRLRRTLIHVQSERRLLWGQRVHAGMHLAKGAYSDALNALGVPSQDGPSEAGMREFVHTLLGLPPARPDDDPLLHPHDPYLRLARGVRQLIERGTPPDMSGISGAAEQGYARLIEAISLIRTPEQAVNAALTLGRTPPPWDDQRVYWAVVRLSAFVEGSPDVDPLEVAEVLKDALASLRSPRDVLQVIRTLAPDRYMLLLIGPTAELAQSLGLPSVPLLTGQYAVRGSERIRLIGRTGRNLVLEAALVPDRDDLYVYERSRAQAALAPFGGLDRVANMGWVLRGTARLRDFAAQMGDERALTEWDIACQRAWALLGPDMRGPLENYSPGPIE